MSTSAKLTSITISLWVVNVALAYTLKFNPLFCWGGLVVGPVWKAFAEILFLCSIGFFIFALCTSWRRVPVTIGAMVFVSAAPQFCLILTGGGSC